MAAGTPRRIGGGRSERYDERRAQRETWGQSAIAWSDAAALATHAAITQLAQERNTSTNRLLPHLFHSAVERERLLTTLEQTLGQADVALAATIMEERAARVAQAMEESGEAAAAKLARGFVKPLQRRRRSLGEAKVLEVERVEGEETGLADWVSTQPERERQRDIGRSRRIEEGMARWPMDEVSERGVVCYERARGRLDDERRGRAEAGFVSRLVHTEHLPTALAKAADHYVLVTPGEAPRFMTVEEVGRTMGLDDASPLMHMLSTPTLSVNHAVECLGRSVHVGVARQIVRTLMARGLMWRGMKYGSGYSGIDTFAAAVHAETGGEFTYEFASESQPHVRRGLLHAWGGSGLTEERCYWDGCSTEAQSAPHTDTYVLTTTCEQYSRRNRLRGTEGQRRALGEVWSALGYVRQMKPGVVVLENVDEKCCAQSITGLCLRLREYGYEVETGALDPWEIAGAHVDRWRRYWVLVRRECA